MQTPTLATVIDDRAESICLAKAMLSSAHLSGWNGKYIILYCGNQIEKLNDFKKKNISIDQVASPFKNENENWFKMTTWNKLHLFSSKYEKYRPILYMDADVLVYNNLDFVNSINYFGAIRNHHSEEPCSGKVHYCILEEIVKQGLSTNYNNPQFNAGVFVIGQKIENIFQEIINLTSKIRDKCILRDQSALNVFFQDWENLPQKYNYNIEVILENSYHNKCSDYSIVHYLGNYYETFGKEFKRFYNQFNEIDFRVPLIGKACNISHNNNDKIIKIKESLFNTFKRAWPYVYNYDCEFKKRNPNPNKINPNEQIKVPKWLNV